MHDTLYLSCCAGCGFASPQKSWGPRVSVGDEGYNGDKERDGDDGDDGCEVDNKGTKVTKAAPGPTPQGACPGLHARWRRG